MRWARALGRSAACAWLILGLPVRAAALLAPAEVLVVANRNVPASVRLARFYQGTRGIPGENLVVLDLPRSEAVSRRVYEEGLARPLRRELERRDEQGRRIRCLALVYGVPLRVAGPRAPDRDRRRADELDREIRRRERALKALEKGGGEAAEVRRRRRAIQGLRWERRLLRGGGAAASVDSELALVREPSYALEGARPNPWYVGDHGRADRAAADRVLLVARLDGPDPAVVERMIRDAAAVEARGLDGTVYLDARGLHGGDAYAAWDEDIRRTARLLRGTRLRVVLDDRPELLEGGEHAALYCGWYSLGRYRGAWKWVPGAVGYHVASAEAVSLHRGDKAYWVKEMLAHGAAASLGPVAEPYLGAFPRPSLFFPLLLSGRYTLVETYFLSAPTLSWMMVLVGDPLYNPFAARPALVGDDLPPAPGDGGRVRGGRPGGGGGPG